jgi:hypothetical protein
MVRAIGAIALTLSLSSSLSSAALAGNHRPGVVRRVSCSVVRFYVAGHSASTMGMWARHHGATDAQIESRPRLSERRAGAEDGVDPLVRALGNKAAFLRT